MTFPIVTDPSDVQPGEEFRLEKDPKNVIRIRWRKPQEATYPYMAVKDVSVAGISQANVRTNVLSFIAGTERSLALVRDPQNKFDKNAIKVIGNWKTKSGGTNSGQLGWVPREIAEEIAEDKDLANAHLYPTLRTIFLPSAGKSAGLRFDIWI
ncbi:MAG: HIRAN domain-containing protein [Syntrophobacteraceae bacterium]